jgi:hypothetical protein
MKRLFRDLALMIIAAALLWPLLPERFAVNVPIALLGWGQHAAIHGYSQRPPAAAGGLFHAALRERLAGRMHAAAYAYWRSPGKPAAFGAYRTLGT